MAANPNELPPAFRGRPRYGPSFLGMTDDQVLSIAAGAFRMAAILPVRSHARAGHWSDFDHAMGELASRAVVHALEKIHEIHERERQDGNGE